jgi:hypothetical protein
LYNNNPDDCYLDQGGGEWLDRCKYQRDLAANRWLASYFEALDINGHATTGNNPHLWWFSENPLLSSGNPFDSSRTLTGDASYYHWGNLYDCFDEIFTFVTGYHTKEAAEAEGAVAEDE